MIGGAKPGRTVRISSAPHGLDDVSDQVDARDVRLEFPRLDLVQVQDVIHDDDDVARAGLEDVEELGLLFGQGRVVEQRRRLQTRGSGMRKACVMCLAAGGRSWEERRAKGTGKRETQNAKKAQNSSAPR